MFLVVFAEHTPACAAALDAATSAEVAPADTTRFKQATHLHLAAAASDAAVHTQAACIECPYLAVRAKSQAGFHAMRNP